jgi:hypothetical protein
MIKGPTNLLKELLQDIPVLFAGGLAGFAVVASLCKPMR